MLEQLAVSADREITLRDVEEALGLVRSDAYLVLAQQMLAGDTPGSLETINEVIWEGGEPRQLHRQTPGNPALHAAAGVGRRRHPGPARRHPERPARGGPKNRPVAHPAGGPPLGGKPTCATTRHPRCPWKSPPPRFAGPAPAANHAPAAAEAPPPPPTRAPPPQREPARNAPPPRQQRPAAAPPPSRQPPAGNGGPPARSPTPASAPDSLQGRWEQAVRQLRPRQGQQVQPGRAAAGLPPQQRPSVG